eukprot:RCo000236
MARVIVLGSCNMDMVCYAPRMPVPGETLAGTGFHAGFGGKGANQAVMAAKLGAVVTMVSKVGSDSFGESIRGNLRSCGVATHRVLTADQAPSGVACITVDGHGQNAIVYVSGANALLSAEEVLAAEPDLKEAAVLLCQLELPMPVNLVGFELARKHGVRTIFNPAPAPPQPLGREVLELCDVLCVNETEAAQLSGVHPVDSPQAAEAAARVLQDLGS